MDLGELTLEKIKPLVGNTFQLELPDGGTMPMKLDGAVAYELRQKRAIRGAPVAKRAPFAIYFIGAPDPILPQGMYTLRGEELTLEGIFLVPVGKDDEGTEYEAVFG
jgi:hypothetical protein